VVVVVAAVVSGLGFFWPFGPPSLPASAGDEPPALQTVRPVRQALRRTFEQPGQIEGFEQTPLAAKISGFVKKLHADIGDAVRKDQLLAELYVPEAEEELKQKDALVLQADAEVAVARRLLEGAEAALLRADANLQLAEAGRIRAEASFSRWRAESERARVLHRQGAIDQQSLDQVTDQYKSAEAALGESRAAIAAAKAARSESAAQRDKAAADVKVAEAKLGVARADRQRTAAVLSYARITAPFDGVISKRLVDTGAFLQPGGVLFVVVRTDPVRLFVDVPESEAVHVQVGQPARVRVQALDEQEVTGQVARFSWSLDGQTRTLRVQINLANGDGRLRPGMYANARLSVEHAGVLAVPAAAVWMQDDQPVVLRIEDGVARRTPVKVGLRQGGMVQVLKKQVRPPQPGEPFWDDFRGDEDIVISNPAAVPDGQQIRRPPVVTD
jgi:multidrug efflux pump subunit AcrA (membrane-fusion protein)